MHSSNHWPRFNPLNYIFNKPYERPFYSRTKSGTKKGISQSSLPSKKIEARNNRYEILPSICEEPASRLYCLLRRCRSATDYLKDQMVHLSNTLKKSCLTDCERFGAKGQMVNKQLSFLKILMAQINVDLDSYSFDLKKAVEKKKVGGYVLKKEGDKIEAELSDIKNTITFTKKSLYDLLRQYSMLPSPPEFNTDRQNITGSCT